MWFDVAVHHLELVQVVHPADQLDEQVHDEVLLEELSLLAAALDVQRQVAILIGS